MRDTFCMDSWFLSSPMISKNSPGDHLNSPSLWTQTSLTVFPISVFLPAPLAFQPHLNRFFPPCLSQHWIAELVTGGALVCYTSSGFRPPIFFGISSSNPLCFQDVSPSLLTKLSWYARVLFPSGDDQPDPAAPPPSVYCPSFRLFSLFGPIL